MGHSSDPWLCRNRVPTKDGGHTGVQEIHCSLTAHAASGNRHSHPFHARIHTGCKQQKGRKKRSNIKVGSYFTPAPLSYELHLLCQSQQSREVLASSLCVVSEPRRSQETWERVIWKIFYQSLLPTSFSLQYSATNPAQRTSQS